MDRPNTQDGLLGELCPQSRPVVPTVPQPVEEIIDRPDIQRVLLGLSLCVMLFGMLKLMISSPVENHQALGHPTTGFRVDVNHATAAELTLLPQVGPVLADRIIEEREAHGPFLSVADIARTAGIGPDRIANLEPLVATSP